MGKDSYIIKGVNSDGEIYFIDTKTGEKLILYSKSDGAAVMKFYPDSISEEDREQAKEKLEKIYLKPDEERQIELRILLLQGIKELYFPEYTMVCGCYESEIRI